MNDIAWDKRNSLHVETVSNLMFLALNGLPLENFDPLPHVRSWIDQGHRKSTSWVTGPRVSSRSERHSKHYDLMQQLMALSR